MSTQEKPTRKLTDDDIQALRHQGVTEDRPDLVEIAETAASRGESWDRFIAAEIINFRNSLRGVKGPELRP